MGIMSVLAADHTHASTCHCCSGNSLTVQSYSAHMPCSERVIVHVALEQDSPSLLHGYILELTSSGFVPHS